MEDLFELITKIIASPHTTITKLDRQRAIQVFLAVDDFLIDEVPSYTQSECDNIDFGAFAAGKIDELEEKRTDEFDYEKLTSKIDELNDKIAKHDETRIAYLIGELPSYSQSECDSIDFGAFAAGKIDELDGK
jgi:hypothetical protein